MFLFFSKLRMTIGEAMWQTKKENSLPDLRDHGYQDFRVKNLKTARYNPVGNSGREIPCRNDGGVGDIQKGMLFLKTKREREEQGENEARELRQK